MMHFNEHKHIDDTKADNNAKGIPAFTPANTL
jgi:hypothetical protein